MLEVMLTCKVIVKRFTIVEEFDVIRLIKCGGSDVRVVVVAVHVCNFFNVDGKMFMFV